MAALGSAEVSWLQPEGQRSSLGVTHRVELLRQLVWGAKTLD